jgi:plasmid maintenance system antidote protein VapI
LTVQTALRLENVLNIPAKIWLNLQTNYELDLINLQKADVCECASN